ncbi:hypothetical protein UFOVP270_27 [uncultured Caudovirales phage]|uniref:Uncharacterized protein n=1 Tax=uncultured Caudovirales phage TaxID=2100421 RepID=A0A6J5L3L2_9CAUD|nr:hypothetical protein UFOVP101_29 [uncultured Caudovirales phage]CAB4134186.1 hypothetical protein UFOVP270_27 [uncultured Caudovirales phage]
MALDPHYITDGPLEEYFVDKDSGLPLAGGFIYFFRDSSRITPKTVYQLTGSPPNYTYVALPNPITLSAVGTVQDAAGDNVVIYYYPWEIDGITPDLYYVVVQDSNGVDQFTREAWPNPNEGGSSPSPSSSLPVQNQISNPQFSQILINDVSTLTPATTVFTVSGANNTFEVAPDWTLVASCSGTDTVTVQRIPLYGQLEAVTSPPFALSITTGITITSCILRQRFFSNSGLWTSTAAESLFLSGGIVVKNLVNVSTTVSMWYQASSGVNHNVPVQILSATVGPSSDFTYYSGGSTQVPISDDPLAGNNGYIDIYVQFTPGSSVEITSIQVVPSINVAAAPTLLYDVASSNRNEALLGDYYIPRLQYDRLSSLLTGWDFPLNPAQFGSAQTIAFGTPAYVWDQTICNSVVGNVAVTRNAIDGSIKFAPASNNDALYMIQYLSGAQVQEMLYTRLSSNVSAYCSSGSTVTLTMQFYVGDSSATIPSLPTTIGTINNLGVFSLTAANWSIVPRNGLDTARMQIQNVVPTPGNDVQFQGWQMSTAQTTSPNSATLFAVVVTIAWTTAPTAIDVMSISLNKGDLPSRPLPQTPSDVLSECQYYFEQSYDTGSKAGAVTSNGCLLVPQFSNTSASTFQGRSFGLQYKTNKRVAPNITFYSVDGTVDNVQTVINNQGTGQTNANVIFANFWTPLGPGTEGGYFLYDVNADLVAGSSSGRKEVFLLCHYLADARLGIV